MQVREYLGQASM